MDAGLLDSVTRTLINEIKALGYDVVIDLDEGLIVAQATRGDEVHRVTTDGEGGAYTAVCELAALVGIELADG